MLNEHTVLGIIAPEASILVQNAPKSLAAGLGWRFGNNFLGVNYVPPCLWPVPPCCFEAGYGPGANYCDECTHLCNCNEYYLMP